MVSRTRTARSLAAAVLTFCSVAHAQQPAPPEPVVLRAPAPKLPYRVIGWGPATTNVWTAKENGDGTHALALLDITTGEVSKEYSTGAARPLGVSANGRAWYGSGDSGLVVGQVGRSTSVPVESRASALGAAAFTPTGSRLILLALGAQSADVVDARTGKLQRTCALDSFMAQALAVSPGGQHIAVASSTKWLEVHSLAPDGAAYICGERGRRPERLSEGSLQYTSNGKQLLHGDLQGRIRVWNVETGATDAHIQVGKSQIARIAVAKRALVAAVTTKGGLLALVDFRSGVRWQVAAGAAAADLFIAADGSRVVLSQANACEVFDGKTGEALESSPGHLGTPIAAAWRDADTLVTVGDDARICTWNAKDGSLQKTVRMPREAGGGYLKPVLAANGSVAAWPLADGNVLVVPTDDPESSRTCVTRVAKSVDGLEALALDAGGSHLAVAATPIEAPGRQGAAKVLTFDLAAKSPAREVPGLSGDIDSIALAPGGRRIALGSSGAVRIADVESGQVVPARGLRGGPNVGLTWSPDGNLLFVRAKHLNAHVFDGATGEQVQNVGWSRDAQEAKHVSPDVTETSSVSFVGGSRVVVAICQLPWVRVWDGLDGRVLADVRLKNTSMTALAPSPDGRHLAVVTIQGVEIHDLAAAGGERLTAALTAPPAGRVDSRKRPLPEGATRRLYPRGKAIDDAKTVQERMAAAVSDVRFLPDGKSLAVAAADGWIRICDFATGKVQKTISFTGAMPYRIDVDDAGERLAALALRRDANAKGGAKSVLAAWELPAGRRIWEVAPDGDVGAALALSPDGTRIVSSTRKGLDVWTIGEKKSRSLDMEDRIRFATFSRDSRAIVVSGFEKLHVIDAAEASLLLTLQRKPDDEGASTFHAAYLTKADAGEIRALDRNGRSCVWDLAAKKRLSTGIPTIYSVEQASFHRDGSLVAVAGDGGPLVVLRFEDGAELLHIPARREQLDRIGFDISPDGAWLATGEMNATVLLWPLDAKAD